MSSVNKVSLLGRLGQTPELKEFKDGGLVTKFSICTPENWVDSDGKKQEKIQWTQVVVFGKLAKAASKFLVKGRQVYVDGKLQTRSYEKEGVKHFVTEVIAQNIRFLGSKPKDQEDLPINEKKDDQKKSAPKKKVA